MVLSEARCRELGEFLRVCRARLQPETVNLPRGKRRRTPGLKREEVAMLAGVSTEWYTHLEQARQVRASPETLTAIGEALQLQPREINHLLQLGGYQPNPTPASARLPSLSPQLQRLLDVFPYPAWIYNARRDILGGNAPANLVHGDLAGAQGYERNALYRLYMPTEYRARLVDWERHAKGFVGVLRLQYAELLDDPWTADLIQYLVTHSPEFAGWWNSHHIQPYQDGEKEYDHPELGRLAFEFTVSELHDTHFSHCCLVQFVPKPGTDTAEKLRRLEGRY
ncbi:helix-turn-helix transcriptional regulator [Acanthopleuribacter pedis]|uniref:Helix-turn-helix domain-containing protein n=1 Tax=Acanthopleuribacter pedis TaxID=442870 RepID=A0A8J7U3I5_9BACT|nr:helix-turn-helix transcriptional regulator [Acanthopleuribacter pedis]MBO1318388.1 helix-turn-helix domain-containing protein [Acanthopleuribacter pedis]